MAAMFETVDRHGIKRKRARIRGATRKRSGPIPIASMASTSSETCMVPSSAVKDAAHFAQKIASDLTDFLSNHNGRISVRHVQRKLPHFGKWKRTKLIAGTGNR